MDDLVGLKNLVVNTAFVNVEHEHRNKLRKQRLALALLKPNKILALRAIVGKNYEWLCELQPIGNKLFQQFLLSSNVQYAAAAEFLEELSEWTLAEAELKERAKRSILAKFCQPASSFLSCPTRDAAEVCKDLSDGNFDEVLMDKLKDHTKDFLRGKPFSDYLKSPFFYRFLQWKEYEKQKISDKYFYEFRILGRGGFGEVCAVQVKTTGQMYACKKLDKRRLKKKSGEKLALLEKQILEKVNSVFIVNLAYAYDSKTHLCLVMDLMNGGDLSSHIYELGQRGIRMERVIYYTAQITAGILHLHSMDIVYRDMKPKNVLLDSKGQCRLSDFGLAVELPKGKTVCQKVCAVQVKTTGQMYACKKLDKRRLKKKSGEKLALLEKQILEKVNSVFIVNLAYAYDSKTHLCLVMDLMNGGDLSSHIYELGQRGIRMERVIYYTAQITAGILHLHSMDIVYRDMKPKNVLLDSKGQCRLSDFGLAVELPKGKTVCQKAGTTGYMAPEILRQQFYGASVDWWALGCSIYEMVAARLPFKDFREKVQNEEVTRRTLEDECKFGHKSFDAPTKEIISLLLKKKITHRLGCQGDDPQKHKFFNSINFHRLEAGLVEPPWVPKPNVVYAKDTDEFRATSEVEDVALDAKDEKFFKEFSTGAVSIQWQKEMIDSGLFDELNDPTINGHDCGLVSRMCIVL